MNIVIQYDSTVANAPAGYKAAVQAAVQYLDTLITTPITTQIVFSYGAIAGQAMASGALGESSSNGWFLSYGQLKQASANAATSFDAMVAALSLPGADPSGGGTYYVTDAQAKALGYGSNPSFVDPQDGYVALTSQYALNYDVNNRAVAGQYDAFGILIHEITEVLGRVSDLGSWTSGGQKVYSALDLFRYSAPGAHTMGASAGYFSVDGKTMLTPFNDPASGADGGDWNNTGDSFGYGVAGKVGAVTPTDIRLMNVLGYGVSTASGTPVLGLGYSEYQADAATLAQITHPYAVNLSGVTVSARTNVEADSHVSTVALSDTAGHLQAAFDALNADAKLGSIVVADNQAITLTQAQATADAHAIALAVNADGTKATVTISNPAPTSPPPPPPPPPATGGQVLTATTVGSTLTGGAGDDTFYASQGNDVLTGGGGSNTYVFGKEPWSPDHITDFKPGSDKLDLTALFRASGYAGTDPVKDGYIYLVSDGNGGTLVRFDRDGFGSAQPWANSIIDLDHLSPAGLTWGQISGAATVTTPTPTPTPTPAPVPTPTGAGDQVLTATTTGAVLIGGAGNDTFYASQGNDTLTGAAGADTFVFQKEPWSPDHITDFKVGVDKLDLSALLHASGYTGTDPVRDGYIYLADDGAGGTMVRFDHDGAGSNPVWPNSIIDLDHVSSAGLTWAALSSPSGVTIPTPTPGAPPVTAPGTNPGLTLTASGPGQTLTGGAGDDTLVGGPGNDTLTGAAGVNTFRFTSEPWAPNTVTDFKPGVDKLDFSALLHAYGYAGTDPVKDGWLYVYGDGAGGSLIRFDHDGPGTAQLWPNTIIDLQHVDPTHVFASDWILH